MKKFLLLDIAFFSGRQTTIKSPKNYQTHQLYNDLSISGISLLVLSQNFFTRCVTPSREGPVHLRKIQLYFRIQRNSATRKCHKLSEENRLHHPRNILLFNTAN